MFRATSNLCATCPCSDSTTKIPLCALARANSSSARTNASVLSQLLIRVISNASFTDPCFAIPTASLLNAISAYPRVQCPVLCVPLACPLSTCAKVIASRATQASSHP
jgi:hypothetical protein